MMFEHRAGSLMKAIYPAYPVNEQYPNIEGSGADVRGSLRAQFIETMNLVEKAYRQMGDVVKDELERHNMHGINSAQAMLLFKIGDREVTAGRLCEQGDYLGSNLSYNLGKLARAGYVRQERAQADQRSVLVRLTEKGQNIHKMLAGLFSRHVVSLEAVINVGSRELDETNTVLHRLEHWIAQTKHADNQVQVGSTNLLGIQKSNLCLQPPKLSRRCTAGHL
jgi:DNA-binding MarR family transcriptional regulator